MSPSQFVLVGNIFVNQLTISSIAWKPTGGGTVAKNRELLRRTCIKPLIHRHLARCRFKNAAFSMVSAFPYLLLIRFSIKQKLWLSYSDHKNRSEEHTSELQSHS